MPRLTLLKGKLHRATVTEVNVDYEGSVTLDSALMEAAGILPFERVEVWDVTNGARLTTYAIVAPAGSGTVCLNGAAAHLVKRGDLVIIAAFVDLDPHEVASHKPRLVRVDGQNRVESIGFAS